jgi:probable addiction module antidote protein
VAKFITAKKRPLRGSASPDPATAAAYVNSALAEEVEDEEELFLLALRAMAQAHGMSKLAKQTTLKRENLYRMLSRVEVTHDYLHSVRCSVRSDYVWR